jgi:lipoprotein NlpI
MASSLLLVSIFSFLNAPAQADNANELLKQARDAWTAGKREQALQLASQAVTADPNNPRTILLHGQMQDALGHFAEAVADFDRTLKLDPKLAEAYDFRGSSQFKRGKFAEAVADFDRFLALRPAEAPGHWRRGIALYYVGRYADGRQQFKGYESVDTNDVENAVWHFLCNARLIGIDKARTELLKIGKDRRVPMMQVYELFAGKLKPDDVLKAAREGHPPAAQLNARLFYAHLYLGLYAEAAGDKKLALEHLTEAAQKHKIGHYMWDVARVHMELLKKAK